MNLSTSNVFDTQLGQNNRLRFGVLHHQRPSAAYIAETQTVPVPLPNLILVRHCEATGQRPYAPLTNAGVQQSQTLAEFLSDYPIDHITTSQYLRARQSIEPFATVSDLPIHTDPRLNERILSAEPIENWQEVIRDSFDDHDLRAPGGESAREVWGRAWAALDENLASGHSMPLVVTHGYLMALVLHSLDPSFGFEGWKSLSNPDVYLLQHHQSSELTHQRIWQPQQFPPDRTLD